MHPNRYHDYAIFSVLKMVTRVFTRVCTRHRGQDIRTYSYKLRAKLCLHIL